MLRDEFKQLSAIFAVFFCCVTAGAYDFKVGEIFYNITSETELTVEVTYESWSAADGYVSSYTGDIVIPSAVVCNGKNYTVTAIGRNAFAGCVNVASLSVPGSVTNVYDYAFKNCTSLTKLRLEDDSTMLSFGCNPSEHQGLFNDCPLESIYLGRNFEYSQPYGTSHTTSPFNQQDALTSVTIGNSVTDICMYAFSCCTALQNVTIPGSVKNLGHGAFYKCSGLTSISIPESVKSMHDYLFDGCTALKSVTLPNSIAVIPYAAFRDCTSLTAISIPMSVVELEGYAFVNCNSLRSITIPNNVKTIGPDAFCNCEKLLSVYIGDGVSEIGDRAFIYCEYLKNVTFGKGLKTIGESAFENCCMVENLTLPDSLTIIGARAFMGCEILSEIFIPESVKEISRDAFSYTALEEVTIGAGVELIGPDAFYMCEKLKTVVIGKSVKNIKEDAFDGCEAVTSIYSHIPADSLCEVLERAFSGIDKNSCVLYVPKGAVNKYSTTRGGRDFFNIMEFESTAIDDVIKDSEISVTANGVSVAGCECEAVAIYAANGALVVKINEFEGGEILLDKGVYIVRVGNKTTKVVIE